MLKICLQFYHYTQTALEDKVPLDKVTALPVLKEIARMKELPPEKAEKEINLITGKIGTDFAGLGVK